VKCPRCLNEDDKYFYLGHKGYYCRKCVSFSRVLIDEDIKAADYDVCLDSGDFEFSYELTSKQIEASNKCAEYIKHSDVLLFCVCGAGKTEIVIKSISEYLSKGLKVAYAISRKEVVKELEFRFKQIFKNTNVVAVYGGHHDVLYGDLIICTTHQLYRYYKNFDLLILDEVDAFPLKGNETLMNIALNSCKGNLIYSTATINDFLIKYLNKREYKKVELYVRPSNKPLIVPKIIFNFNLINIIVLFFILKKQRKCIIFVPSKKWCVGLYHLFNLFYKCTYVYADLGKRNENILDFKDEKYNFIFATTVLERGITIRNVDVIICDFIAGVFDESNIIQMSGRVGRGIDNPIGNAYILTNHLSKYQIKSIDYLKVANSYL